MKVAWAKLFNSRFKTKLICQHLEGLWLKLRSTSVKDTCLGRQKNEKQLQLPWNLKIYELLWTITNQWFHQKRMTYRRTLLTGTCAYIRIKALELISRRNVATNWKDLLINLACNFSSQCAHFVTDIAILAVSIHPTLKDIWSQIPLKVIKFQ